MTVSSQTSRVSYSGNGSTTAFAVSFYFLADSHLKVILRAADGSETVKALGTDYTVSGAGNPSGGTVTMGTAPASGTTLVIVRNVPLTQETDYQANDSFPAESHERALDKLTMEVQQVGEVASRAIVRPISESTVDMTLPPVDTRANKYLSFDLTGKPVSTTFDIDAVQNASTAAIAAAAAAATSEGNAANSANIATTAQTFVSSQVAAVTPHVERFSGDDSETEFTLSSTPGAEENTLVFISGVYQQKDTYTVSGTTLTFSVAPPSGTDNIEVQVGPAVQLQIGSALGVGYQPSGTGAVLRNVQDKLRETVSVKDFGAVGDGVANDYAAFTAAFAASSEKRLRIPAGTYNLTFAGSTGFTPPANIVIEGDGADFVTLNITPPNSASYPRGFSLSAGNITFKGVTVNYLVPSGGKGLLFVTSSSNLRFENCKFDGAVTNSGASLSHENHCLAIPSSGTSNDVEAINCDFTRWNYTILKANSSTCTNRRWSFLHCDSYGSYNEDFAFNSPNGVFDDVQIYMCRFRDGAGAGASLNQLYTSFASISNFRVGACSFEGVANNAIHIEENCINWTVTGNTINIDGIGIFLVDNNIAGSYTMPQQGSIVGNAISKAGTLKESSKHGIWIANGGGASTVSLKRATVSDNVVVGFEFGIYCDATVDDTCIVSGNAVYNCVYGFRVNAPSVLFKGNASSNCTYGFFTETGGAVQDHVFTECTLAAVSGTIRPVVLFNPSFTFTEFSVSAGATVNKVIVPLLANARAYGHMHVSEWCEISFDSSDKSHEVTWDGASFTSTAKVSYEPGAVQCASVRNGNNLAIQVYAASSRTTVRLDVKFNGMLSLTTS